MKNTFLLLAIILSFSVNAQVETMPNGNIDTVGAKRGNFVTAADVAAIIIPYFGSSVTTGRKPGTDSVGVTINGKFGYRFMLSNTHIIWDSIYVNGMPFKLWLPTNYASLSGMDSLRNAIANIQLTPGPQGPTGNTGSVGATGPAGSNASVTSASIASALGYTPYNAANPNSFISSVPAQSFTSLTGKPTTLAGYGITDAYPLSGNPSAFLTGITSAQINTALGFTPYSSTNPNGFISSVPAQTFASLTGKPTTLSGYGITDAYPLTGNPSSFLTAVPAQSWSSITGKPTFATVATSGSYADLSSKPAIPDTISLNNRINAIKQPVFLPDIAVGETATLAILAGFRNVVVTCTGIISGERVLVTQNAITNGYVIASAVATANNQITVQVSVPAIALGGSYSLASKVTVFR